MLAFAREASAGNSDSFYYSDEAAMTAGSVVAKTRDAGAIWYNPAGLGGIQRGQIDLSATTFAIRIRKVPRALSTTVPQGGTNHVDLDSADFFSAPHALTLIRNVSPSATRSASATRAPSTSISRVRRPPSAPRRSATTRSSRTSAPASSFSGTPPERRSEI